MFDWNWFRGLLVIATLSACAELDSSAEGESLGGASAGDPLPRNQGVGSQLSFSNEGLGEHISEFSGALSVSLPVARVGEHTLNIGYRSQSDWQSMLHKPRDFTGMPYQWHRPWLARLVLRAAQPAATGVQINVVGVAVEFNRTAAQQSQDEYNLSGVLPQGAHVTFADGRSEELFAPTTLEHSPGPEAGGRLLTSGRSVWRRSGASSFSGPSNRQWGEFSVTTPHGLTYYFLRCTRRDDTDDQVCEAGRVEDRFGNGLQIYYHRGDQSSVPRVAEAYRSYNGRHDSTYALSAYTPVSRAYFYLDGQPQNGEPQDVNGIDLGIARQREIFIAGQSIPRWPTRNRITAIAYPGPNADPLSIDDRWHRTTFEYADQTLRWANIGNSDWWQLRAVNTEGQRYEFQYASNGQGPERVAGANQATHGTLSSVGLPHGQTVAYDWASVNMADAFGTTVPNRLNEPTEHWGIRARHFRINDPATAAPQTFSHRIARSDQSTVLFRGSVSQRDRRLRLHRVTVQYPTDLATVTDYHPLGAPGTAPAARTGQPAARRIYLSPRIDSRGELITSSAPAYSTQEFGYAVFAAGTRAIAPPDVQQIDRWGLSFQVGLSTKVGPSVSSNWYVARVTPGYLAQPAFVLSHRSDTNTGVGQCTASEMTAHTWEGTSHDSRSCLGGTAQTPANYRGAPVESLQECFQYDPELYSRGEYACIESRFAGNVSWERVPAHATSQFQAQCPYGWTEVAQCPGPAEGLGYHLVEYRDSSRQVPSEERRDGTHLSTFERNGRADYDVLLHPPFVRDRYLASAPVIAAVPNDELAHVTSCQTRVTQPGSSGTPQIYWDCDSDPDVSQSHDRVFQIVPHPDRTLSTETRFRYALEAAEPVGPNSDRADPIIFAIQEERRCIFGSTCASSANGLIGLSTQVLSGSGALPSSIDQYLGPSVWSWRTPEEIRHHNIDNPAEYTSTYIALTQYAAETRRSPLGQTRIRLDEFDRGHLLGSRFAYRDGSAVPKETYVVSLRTGSPAAERRVEQTEANNWSQVTRSIGENGEVSRVCYDERGRVVAEWGPRSVFSSCANVNTADHVLTYDDQRFAVESTSQVQRDGNSRRVRTRTFFDGLGRPSLTATERAARALGSTWIAAPSRYFADTSLVTVSPIPYEVADPASAAAYRFTGARQETQFDVLGRTLRTAQIDGTGAVRSESRTRYGDTDAQLSWLEEISLDPQGGATRALREVNGRPVSLRRADGSELTSLYDALGRPRGIRQADGLESLTELNGWGQVRSRTTPEAGTARYDYAIGGALRSTTHGNITRTNQYDVWGRIELQRAQEGTAPSTELARYQYDVAHSLIPIGERFALGRVTRATTPASDIYFGYDQDGLISEQVSVVSNLPLKRLSRQYDSSGSVVRQVYQQGAEDESILDFAMSGYGFDVTEVALNGTRLQTDVLNALGQLRQRTFEWDGAAIQTLDYTYDEFGRLTAFNNPASLGNDAFAYALRRDNPVWGAAPRRDGRLAEFEWATAGGSRAVYRYGYDSVGHMVDADYRALGAQTFSAAAFDLNVRYSASGLAQIDTLTRHDAAGLPLVTHHQYQSGTRRLAQTTGAETSAYGYGTRGEVQTFSAWGSQSGFGYHLSGRPSYVADGDVRMAYAYDHSGDQVQLTQQNFYSPCGSAGGVNLAGDPISNPALSCYRTSRVEQVVRDPDGHPVAEYVDGQIARLFIGSAYLVPEAAEADERGLHVTLSDHLGSTRAVVNQSGEVIYRSNFDPFGQRLTDDQLDSAGVSSERFATYRRQDLRTPIDFARARQFAPTLGRFLSPDPLAAHDPFHDAYTYAGNDPANNNDPSGLITVFGGGGPGFDLNTAAGWAQFESLFNQTYGATPTITAQAPGLFQSFGNSVRGAFDAFGGAFSSAGQALATGWDQFRYVLGNRNHQRVSQVVGRAARDPGVQALAFVVAPELLVARAASSAAPALARSSAVDKIVAQLGRSGASMSFPRGFANMRQLAQASELLDSELAVVRVSGQRMLYRGTASQLSFPARGSLIAHTHPGGMLGLRASEGDILALLAMDSPQYSSTIITTAGYRRFFLFDGMSPSVYPIP